jgi:transposase
MTISAEMAARILRLHDAERWRVGTIARQLGVHRDTVKRVLGANRVGVGNRPLRGSKIDPYRLFIIQTLERYPTLNAARLYVMVRERGYKGGASHFRHLIGGMRPRRSAEAFLRLRTLPGEEAQCDWAHLGYLQVGRARRALMAFLMVLSYSRRIYLRFFLNARMESFLRGHVEAFAAFGGVPRVVLYDNLKSAVLERIGDAIRFNPTLLEFAGHYRYEPRPVAVARGSEKGRVERSVQYVRSSFFAGREFTGLDDLNAQARSWCEGLAGERRWAQDSRKSQHEAFVEEQPSLMELPQREYPLGERLAVQVGKYPYVRFDLNDYTVPHTHVRRTLEVLATEKTIRVFDGIQEIASHVRSYDCAQQVEDASHLEKLVQSKRAAKAHRAVDRLAQAVPASSELLRRAAQRGNNLGSITSALMRLLDRYGAVALERAIGEALMRDVPHPNAVRLELERAREAQGHPPPVAVMLSAHAASLDAPVKAHALASYDKADTPLTGDANA